MKPRLLDLFCGAGGAAVGYARAGFEVVGVDLVAQPHYPFEFIQEPYEAALFDLMNNWPEGTFDAIHASPPCQAYSVLRRANPGAEYPDLVAPTRELLEATGLPWVMENVPGAPLFSSIVLCGSMFDLGAGERQLRRHRLFETSFAILQPECRHQGEAVGVYGGAVGRYTFENGCKQRLGRRGGYQGTAVERKEAMGIDWMNGREINQAIPPAYTEFIGAQLLDQLTNQRRPDMARINAHSTTAPRLGAYRDCDATDGGSE
jgi:DNA (cytosine-5)-methyltransferase 1